MDQIVVQAVGQTIVAVRCNRAPMHRDMVTPSIVMKATTSKVLNRKATRPVTIWIAIAVKPHDPRMPIVDHASRLAVAVAVDVVVGVSMVPAILVIRAISVIHVRMILEVSRIRAMSPAGAVLVREMTGDEGAAEVADRGSEVEAIPAVDAIWVAAMTVASVDLERFSHPRKLWKEPSKACWNCIIAVTAS